MRRAAFHLARAALVLWMAFGLAFALLWALPVWALSEVLVFIDPACQSAVAGRSKGGAKARS